MKPVTVKMSHDRETDSWTIRSFWYVAVYVWLLSSNSTSPKQAVIIKQWIFNLIKYALASCSVLKYHKDMLTSIWLPWHFSSTSISVIIVRVACLTLSYMRGWYEQTERRRTKVLYHINNCGDGIFTDSIPVAFTFFQFFNQRTTDVFQIECHSILDGFSGVGPIFRQFCTKEK